MFLFTLHGEGIVFSAAAHLILGGVALFALIGGVLRAESRVASHTFSPRTCRRPCSSARC